MTALEQRVHLVLGETFAPQLIFFCPQLNFSSFQEQCEIFNCGEPGGGWRLIRNWGRGRYFAQLK